MGYRTLAAIALTAAISSAGCSAIGQSARGPGFDSKAVLADIAAFQGRPSPRTWLPLGRVLLENPADPALTSSVVEAISQQPISAAVMNEAAVDLADADWAGAMRWIRLYNIASRTQSGRPVDRQMVESTARLGWLLLALRPNYAKDAVDLSRTDLRDEAPFIGQAMNFANVDFSVAMLSGGTWRQTNLDGTRFSGVSISGQLRCVGCSLGRAVYPGSLTLVDGRWAPSRNAPVKH